MNNLVKLIFNCISTGSGWADLTKNAKASLANMNQLGGALKNISVIAGTTGGLIGRALSAFATGNIWGIAQEGVKILIEKFGLFKDKTEETKEKLDKLEEASRKFYETINSNSQKSLEKIDKETRRRNEQLDITNRMIKAELQLQKARAIAAGDKNQTEYLERQIAKADQQTELEKAVSSENAAGTKYRTAEGDLDAARKAAKQAQDEIEAIQSRIFYQQWDKERSWNEYKFKQAFGPNARFDDSALWNDFRKNFRYSEDETKQITAAKDRLALAEKTLEAARKTADEKREEYQQARDNVKILKEAQKAADEEAIAKRMAEDIKAEKERIAKEDAEEKKRLKDEEDAEKEIQKKRQDKKLRDLDEYWRKEKEARKKALQDDIEANRKRADDLQQRLSDANERAKKAHDVFGNAEKMDQAGRLSEKRRESIENLRFANRSAGLILNKKIRRGADGEWVANGRLSNIDQAVLERMNAELNKKKLENENDKVVKKLDELIQKLEQMSTL